MTRIEEIMRMAPVIPVLVIEDAAHAVPIARALVAGGLPVLEVTLRTASALEVIREMKQVPGAIVGAGTVLNEHALDDALEAGSEFIVSPGLPDSLAKAAIAGKVPFLPGVATAADIMRGLDLGLDRFKFFPAEANGGIPALKAIAAPFGMARFCPTGGITQASAPDWLALDAVLCCGGSWLVGKGPPDVVAIEAAARGALCRSHRARATARRALWLGRDGRIARDDDRLYLGGGVHRREFDRARVELVSRLVRYGSSFRSGYALPA